MGLHVCRTPPLLQGRGALHAGGEEGDREERVPYCHSQEPWKGKGVREGPDPVGTFMPSPRLHCSTGVRCPPRRWCGGRPGRRGSRTPPLPAGVPLLLVEGDPRGDQPYNHWGRRALCPRSRGRVRGQGRPPDPVGTPCLSRASTATGARRPPRHSSRWGLEAVAPHLNPMAASQRAHPGDGAVVVLLVAVLSPQFPALRAQSSGKLRPQSSVPSPWSSVLSPES